MVPTGFGVVKGDSVGIWVINSPVPLLMGRHRRAVSGHRRAGWPWLTGHRLVSGHRIAMRQRVGPVPGKRPPLRPGYVAGMVLEPEPVLVTDPTLTEVLDEL
jgi:hypothetical protein